MNPHAITTSQGFTFDYLNPGACPIGIETIAHALSHVCRFGGHCRHFYSVAQHSIHVSEIVPPELALEALFHDAAEAFLGDVPKPLKRLLPDYCVLEKKIQAVIAHRFSLPPATDPRIKEADEILLVTEQRDLMPEEEKNLVNYQVNLDRALPQRITPWSATVARALFLERWRGLHEP